MSPTNPLNPFTGDVPVPEDERELTAALRAGRISHRIYPYYGWRYGDRGRLFTRSDSAWLAWLTRHDGATCREQVLWLGSVLSNRGMPRRLLETHLRVMERQLSRAVPANRVAYERLIAAADHLAALRRSAIDDELVEVLAEGFVERCGGGPGTLVRGVGRLLVHAVADGRDGVRNAVPSVRDWLIDVGAIRRLPELRPILTEDERRELDAPTFARRWPAAIAWIIAEAERAPAPTR